MIMHPILWPLLACIGLLLPGPKSPNGSSPTNNAAADNRSETAFHHLYDQDDCLKRTGHETCEPHKEDPSSENGLYNAYTLASKVFSEEEMSKISHADFDEQDRLLYMLGYSPNILESPRSYCEEHVYQRDDAEHTCRSFYYKSNSAPYRDGYYIAARYLFEVSDFRFDEENRLLSLLSYRRNVGSDPYGYSEELFFDRGYQAEYDGDRLMSELQYYDYWGTNETGTWEYRIYQYDEQGNCILQVVTTEDEILLHCYEYPKAADQIEKYTYLVAKDWELPWEDGSTYRFCPRWGTPAVQKITADQTVDLELFYGKAMDLGQQHFLLPEDAEELSDDHIHTVEPGDSLWKIARRSYGHGSYYDLIVRMNRSVIKGDGSLLLPGMQLYLPEVGNAQDTRIAGEDR